MTALLLDCNLLSAALRKVPSVRDRIHQRRKAGDRFISCYPVLCELEAGIQQIPNPVDARVRLNRLLPHVRLWPIDATTARLFGELFNELRRKGRVISQVDMIVAALARQYNLTVLTLDRDFEELPDIPVENWLR